MRDYPIVIDEPPKGAAEKASRWLRQRRLSVSALIALVEVVAFLVWHRNTLLLTALVVLVMIVAVMAATRVKAGPVRDVLWIVAISQALVAFIPLVLGVSFALGIIAAIVVLVIIVTTAFRMRL
jgi:hypothetical protein